MIKMKTISIIIPMFNSEKFLPDLFKCLEQCEYLEGDEILLVDNGSKDGTRELCKSQVEKNRKKYLQMSEKGLV